MSSFYRGKIILTGEHSVVYGHPAVLANLNLGITCAVKEGVLNETQKQDRYLQYILQIFAKLAQLSKIQIAIKIESNLPQQSGLGSSAVFAATIFSELAKFYNYSLNADRLYNLVLEAENFIHGRSSGADPSIVVYGGLIAFNQGKIEFLSKQGLIDKTFFLINSGSASETTGEMVKKVADQQSNQKILQKIGLLSRQMINNLKIGVFDPNLLNQNQFLLEQIGVVGEKAREIIVELQKQGTFCKITGAGGIKTGSGYILAWHENSQKLKKELETMNLEFFQTQIGINYEKNS